MCCRVGKIRRHDTWWLRVPILPVLQTYVNSYLVTVGISTVNELPTVSCGRTEKDPWFILLRGLTRTHHCPSVSVGDMATSLIGTYSLRAVPSQRKYDMLPSPWPRSDPESQEGRALRNPSSPCLFLFWWFFKMCFFRHYFVNELRIQYIIIQK